MDIPYRRTLFFLFWASGVSGLTYEVIWTRMLNLVFGNTVYATATVLTVFMSGLAIGSFVFGQLIDHRQDPLRIYAFLEIGLGCYAILLPFLLPQLTPLYTWIYQSSGASIAMLTAARFVISFLLLLIPTILMGGTLPVLSRHCIRSRGTVGKDVGLLYGFNTFGAVVGCFAAGFIFIFIFGIRTTAFLAAAVNIIAGFGALLIFMKSPPLPVQEEKQRTRSERKDVPDGSKRIHRLVLIAFGLSGLTTLAYEVLWTRSLIAAMLTDSYAFSTMLTTMLLGIALGSLLYSTFLDRPDRSLLTFGLLEIGIGLSAVTLIWLLPSLGPLTVKLWTWAGTKSAWPFHVALYSLETFVIMLIPTMLMGMTFPLVSKLYTTHLEDRGAGIGNVYAIGTIGAMLGSLLAGFILIPTVGVIRGVILMSVLNLIIGSTLILATTRLSQIKKRILVVGLSALLLLIALGLPKDIVATVFAGRRPELKLIYYKEGVTTTVTVYDHLTKPEREVGANGYCVAGTSFMLRTTQKIQGHFPLLFHPNPKTVLTVGFGSGETAYTISLHDVEEIHAAEISPEVIEVASRFFTETNHRITENPILTPIIMDGKNYILLTDKTYDVIMNDSIHPGLSGNGSLYTKEYFESCKAHLNPGGIMSSWIPLFQMSDLDFKVMLKTFTEVFPYTTLWFGNNCLNRHAILFGSPDPDFKIDFDLLRKRMTVPAIQNSLQEIHLRDAYDVLDCFIMGSEVIDTYVGDVHLNTDDNAYLEYSTPRSPDSRYIWWQKIALFKRMREQVYPHLSHTGNTPEEKTLVQTTLQKYYNSTNYLLQGIMYDLRNLQPRAVTSYRKAFLLNPDHLGIRYLVSDIVDPDVISRPKTPLEILNNARIAYFTFDYENSINLIHEALAMDSTLAIAHFALGLNYQEMGKPDQARETYETSLRLDPTLEEAKRQLRELGFGVE